MKCYYHNHEDAVAACADCGKSLCRSCASRYTPVLCESCASARIGASKSEVVRNIVLSIVLFIAGIILYIIFNGGFGVEAFATAYCLAGLPWGWSVLSGLTSNIFLFLPVIGWLIYFIVKGFLAIIIGWIALPIKMIKSIAEIRRLNNL